MTRAQWPALVLRAKRRRRFRRARLAASSTTSAPVAIHDLAERPLPPGGLWDPTYPPIPDPPPTPLHWNVCFNDAAERDSRRRRDSRRAVPAPHHRAVDLPDEDWAARSQQSLTAVRAGRFIVAPPGTCREEPVDATVIVIEPSMGFGTGHHATTRMCLRLLVGDRRQRSDGAGSRHRIRRAVDGRRAERRARRDRHRRRSGCDRLRGIQRAAQHAARHDHVPGVRLPTAIRRQPADVVLANLTGGMLTSSAPAIAALVRPQGQLILSGFDHIGS